ncbi:MAG: energy-coupling factor ABC transporter permease [Planctomycetes bacterium]|nr:energy-coupling factor ABC transporter permease [Planctomycetota bacterium]
MRRCLRFIILGLVVLIAWPASARAMHISEGILPAPWAGLWFVVAIPFVAWGLHDIKVRSRQDPKYKTFLAMVGAAVFIISCMPIPIPGVGTCSHPCGTGLAAILIGPGPTVVITSIALLLQALFLAHGGLTTLGANIVSMGVVGGLAGYMSFRVLKTARLPVALAAFGAGAIADWATYASTSFELSSALHADGSMWGMFATIMVAFVPTQLPLGIFEGLLSAATYRFVLARRPELLKPNVAQTEA